MNKSHLELEQHDLAVDELFVPAQQSQVPPDHYSHHAFRNLRVKLI